MVGYIEICEINGLGQEARALCFLLANKSLTCILNDRSERHTCLDVHKPRFYSELTIAVERNV